MPEELLRILIIQPDIIWKNTIENLRQYTGMLLSYQKPVDLILLPEMFTTGFILTPEDISGSMQEEAISWLKNNAVNHHCSIAGSLIIHENRNFFNRLICAHPSGEINLYDKRHLFRMAGEDEHYSQGTHRTISTVKGWRICWQICYDLRFPVWSRNQNDYDVLVYVANWPAQRSNVWKILLKARAIENQSYVIGVNRIGKDGNNIDYLGESLVIDPKGNPLNNITERDNNRIRIDLKYSSLLDFRNKFPVLQDRDNFTVA
jgi:omega-amidase